MNDLCDDFPFFEPGFQNLAAGILPLEAPMSIARYFISTSSSRSADCAIDNYHHFMIDFNFSSIIIGIMGKFLDEFYTLSDEEKYYRTLYLEGKSRAEFVNLPEEVEEAARLEEKIVLSSSYYSKSGDASVIVLKHPSYMPLYLHSHRFVEMNYVLRGSVEENIEGQVFTLGKGSLLILLPGFYHSIGVFDDETIAVNILVSRELFAFLDERFAMELASSSFAVYESLELEKEIEALLQEEQIDDDVTAMRKEVITAFLLLNAKRNGVLKMKREVDKRNEVYQIMSYIEENLKDVTLSSFAAHFNLCEQYASRMIKEKTGQLFSAIVKRLRMETACQLLHNDRLTVKEIAYKVGYSSAEQFSRTFRDYYLMSPGAYRKSTGLV